LSGEDEETARVLVGDSITAQTARTLTNFEAVWEQVVQSRARGYAVQDEEYLIGLRGAASCIYNEDGHVVAALAVTGPTVRIPSERLDQLGKLVSRVCTDITLNYGGQVPQQAAA